MTKLFNKVGHKFFSKIKHGTLEVTYNDGEKKVYGNNQAPFEKIIYERLNDENNGDLTNAQYGWFVDDKQAKKLAAPLVFLNVSTDVSLKPIYKGY